MKARMSFIAAALAATFFVAATTSEAQTIRRFPTNQQGGWYRPPGSTVWMYPAPQFGYQIGGTRIYFGRPWSYNSWNYSYSNNWPYGYPSNYTWPYSRNP